MELLDRVTVAASVPLSDRPDPEKVAAERAARDASFPRYDGVTMKEETGAALLAALGAGVFGSQPAAPPYATPVELTEPVVFAGGAITTTNGIAFSPDGYELYISNPVERRFSNDRAYAGIFRVRFVAGAWSEPERIAWERDLDAYHPVLSMDGRRLLFNSRSHPNAARDPESESIPHNIWVSERDEATGRWDEPVMVEAVSSPAYDSYPSVTRNGDLYFNSDRDGGEGGMDFYVSRFVNGRYQEPVHLAVLSTPDVENDLVVDPDERFVIFNRYIEADRSIDLFISFQGGDGWSMPRKLDALSEPDRWELTPSLSPDGKYFFFEVEHRIMQVDLRTLPSPGDGETALRSGSVWCDSRYSRVSYYDQSQSRHHSSAGRPRVR